MTDPNQQVEIQQAVANRLGVLRTFPVDTTRLDRFIRQEIPMKPPHRWRSRFAAIAASLLIVGATVFMMQPRSAEATINSIAMVRMHMDIVSGKVATMKVESIEQVNKLIAAMAQDAPRIPNAPVEHDMSCCMRKLSDKTVACILLKHEGVPVTMSVARAADVAMPTNAAIVVANGVTYRVQDIDKLHMVMVNHQDNTVCLISEAPAESLISLAARLKQ